MIRKYIDHRAFPNDMNCTVALSAVSDRELPDAIVQRAFALHHHEESLELRRR
jgi:hypothetical protein